MPRKRKYDPRGRNGFLGGRPALPEDERRVAISARVAPETLVRLDDYAARHGLSRGAALDAVVRTVAGE